MKDDARHEITQHVEHLRRVARRLTRNEADASDLVHDTCVNAFIACAKMDAPPDNVRGWLVAILRNNWLNLLRHRRVRARAMPELIHGTPDDWRLHETRALRFQFERAWEELPAQARAIAVQCLIDGEPHEDVSARFGMTPGGVATSIHRTRASLRQSMFDGAR